MRVKQPATPREIRWVAAIAGAFGVYFMMIGSGLVPAPGGARNLHAPLWVVLLAGLVFFLGSAALFLQTVAKANENGELPAGAPQWTRIVQYLIGVAIFASFALIASWIALLGDARQFSSTIPFINTVLLARVMFGIGAVICWISTIAYAVSGARKLLRRAHAG